MKPTEIQTKAGRRLLKLLRDGDTGSEHQAPQSRSSYQMAANTAEFVIPKIEREAARRAKREERELIKQQIRTRLMLTVIRGGMTRERADAILALTDDIAGGKP